MTEAVNLTDTHCHLDLEQFDADRAEVLARARAEGLSRILIPGLDLASSRVVVELAAVDPMLVHGQTRQRPARTQIPSRQ
jgi:TatD DNase family protein